MDKLLLCTQCKETLTERFYCWDCDTDKTFYLCPNCKEKGHQHSLKRGNQYTIPQQDYCAGEWLQQLWLYFADRKCLGKRKVHFDETGKQILGDFEWISYEELSKMSIAVCAFLQSILPPETFVAITGKNSVEWFACVLEEEKQQKTEKKL